MNGQEGASKHEGRENQDEVGKATLHVLVVDAARFFLNQRLTSFNYLPILGLSLGSGSAYNR